MVKIYLDGVSFPTNEKQGVIKNKLEYRIWKEAFFQYILDHSTVNKHTGMIDVAFSFEDKGKLISHMESRIFHGYKKKSWSVMSQIANHHRRNRRLRTSKRHRRKEKMPKWLVKIEHTIRRILIKTLAGLRSGLRETILYLDT